jgi:hypothetical protein
MHILTIVWIVATDCAYVCDTNFLPVLHLGGDILRVDCS